MNLRTRINLLVTILMLLTLVVTVGLNVNDRRAAIREEMEASGMVTLQLIKTVIYTNQFIPGHDTPMGMMHDFLNRLGHVRGSQIRLYDGIGHELYKSPPPTYQSGRNAPAWFVHLMQPPQKPITIFTWGGSVVIIPDASRSILESWDNLKALVGWWLAVFLTLNLVVFWSLGRWLVPLRLVHEAIEHVGAGGLKRKLPKFSLPEMDAISSAFNRMTADLAASIAENQRLAMVVRQSSDAIFITDQAGKIAFWNPAAERLFGYNSAQLQGMPVSQLHAPTDRIPQEHLLGGGGLTQQWCLTCDGSLIFVSASSVPFIDPDRNEAVGEIISMRDVTALHQAEKVQTELKRNRELTRQIQRHMEHERTSLARELHDGLGQYITAIRSIAASIAQRAETTAPAVHDGARAIVDAAGEIYDSVHGIIRVLRPGVVDKLSLNESLDELFRFWRSQNLTIGLTMTLGEGLDQLHDDLNIAIYRIVQEGLTNITRHAQATAAEVTLRRIAGSDTDTGRIQLTVADNGRGLQAAPDDHRHLGLVGMRERVLALQGEVAIVTAPGQGTRIEVNLPVMDKDNEEHDSSAAG